MIQLTCSKQIEIIYRIILKDHNCIPGTQDVKDRKTNKILKVIGKINNLVLVLYSKAFINNKSDLKYTRKTMI